MTSQLYTIIVDYAGGTYISQVHATNERMALYNWCDIFPHEEVPGEVRTLSAEVRTNLDNDATDPIALKGLTAAWCTSISIKQRLALINVIRTA